MVEKKTQNTDQEICLTLDNLLRVCRDGRRVMNSRGEVVVVDATHQDYLALMKWMERRKNARRDAGMVEDDIGKVDPLVSGIRGMKDKGDSK